MHNSAFVVYRITIIAIPPQIVPIIATAAGITAAIIGTGAERGISIFPGKAGDLALGYVTVTIILKNTLSGCCPAPLILFLNTFLKLQDISICKGGTDYYR
jgi:hypothetical protein